ncbi:hypothetical protein prwr041_07880 [Prevotella herbatica]|uniref:Uncharacterized protein n=1 Tax=Prevotella herbatica TaxID=2801997 RepID=A0ABN6EG80_9BACT|nr:hypothetical protein [Prevotella herbatica]BCS84895.1 hypothetical protein prwr041_07880 [Prevotella herbatica]
MKKKYIILWLMIIAYCQTFAQDRLSPLTSNKTREINCVYYSILDKKPDFSYACFSNKSIHGFYGLDNGELTSFEIFLTKNKHGNSFHEKKIKLTKDIINDISSLYEDAITTSSFTYSNELKNDSIFLFSHTNTIAYCSKSTNSVTSGKLVKVSESIFEAIKEEDGSKIESLNDSITNTLFLFQSLMTPDVRYAQFVFLENKQLAKGYFFDSRSEDQKMTTLWTITLSLATVLIAICIFVLLHEKRRKRNNMSHKIEQYIILFITIMASSHLYAQKRLTPLTYKQLGDASEVYNLIINKKPEFSYLSFSNKSNSIHGFYNLKEDELICFETDIIMNRKKDNYSFHEKKIKLTKDITKQISILYKDAILASSYAYQEYSQPDSTLLFIYKNMTATCYYPYGRVKSGSLANVSEDIFKCIKAGDNSKIESLNDSLQKIQRYFSKLIKQDAAQEKSSLVLNIEINNEMKSEKRKRWIIALSVVAFLGGGGYIIYRSKKTKKRKS